jgi:hypothetical protein
MSHYAPAGGSLGAMERRLLTALRGLSRKCENAACRAPGLWRSWRMREADGIRFQKRWYCGAHCFEQAALAECSRLLSQPSVIERRFHRIPIGLLMVSRGIINDRQLKDALALQRQSGGGRIGDHLRDIRAVTDDDIAAGLAAQWGCAVYPLERTREFLTCAALLPVELLESARMLPVHHTQATGTLHLAFAEGIDRSALYAVEQMLQLNTVPCIVSESALRRALEEFRGAITVAAAVFDGPLEIPDVVRTASSYACQVGAQEVSMARSGPFLWMRMRAAKSSKDVLFQAATRNLA